MLLLRTADQAYLEESVNIMFWLLGSRKTSMGFSVTTFFSKSNATWYFFPHIWVSLFIQPCQGSSYVRVSWNALLVIPSQA